MSIAINNDAASEALTQLVPLSGEFPARDGDQATFIPLGSIRTFAGNFASDGSAAAQGEPGRPDPAPCDHLRRT